MQKTRENIARQKADTDNARKKTEEAFSKRPKRDSKNSAPFNAYQIWATGNGEPVYEYPPGYNILHGKTHPDGFFYVDSTEYIEVTEDDSRFIGKPTEGALLREDELKEETLNYPKRNGRNLSLKFSWGDPISHEAAQKHCSEQGRRLPTIREILDYCLAGFAPNSDGVFENNRCENRGPIWTASVDSKNRLYAWLFTNYRYKYHAGQVTRNAHHAVACVECVDDKLLEIILGAFYRWWN